MKLTALIIDDEPLAHEIIIEYLKHIDFIEVVGQCYLATDALSLLNHQNTDLLFLDINMPKLKGIDFLKILSRKPQVIITSAYQEYALQGFELDVCDYLLKPFSFERFVKALNKAHQQHKLIHASQAPSTPPAEPQQTEQIFIKVDKKRLQIELSQISHLEAYGNYVKVWLAQSCHLTARTLSSFAQQLDDELFIRIHKSYIVQKQQIKYIEGTTVHMHNGASLPLGKTFKHLAKNL